MCKKLGAVPSLGWANKYVKENLSILRKSETQHPKSKSVWIFLLGFLGSTQSTIIAMITIIRSRGGLYAKLKQTEKAKIDL